MTDFDKLCSEFMGWGSNPRYGTFWLIDDAGLFNTRMASDNTLTPAGAVAVLEKIQFALWPERDGWHCGDHKYGVAREIHVIAETPIQAVLSAALAAKPWDGES